MAWSYIYNFFLNYFYTWETMSFKANFKLGKQLIVYRNKIMWVRGVKKDSSSFLATYVRTHRDEWHAMVSWCKIQLLFFHIFLQSCWNCLTLWLDFMMDNPIIECRRCCFERKFHQHNCWGAISKVPTFLN